jgi:hypothetical protein
LEARKAENLLSKALNATQWVRRPAFLKAQGRKVDLESYQSSLDRLTSQLDGELATPGPVQLLDRYPMPAMDLSKATFAEVPGRHRGEVLGCKGKFLFYGLRDGSIRLLDMSSVPSRFITLGQGNNNKG